MPKVFEVTSGLYENASQVGIYRTLDEAKSTLRKGSWVQEAEGWTNGLDWDDYMYIYEIDEPAWLRAYVKTEPALPRLRYDDNQE